MSAGNWRANASINASRCSAMFGAWLPLPLVTTTSLSTRRGVAMRIDAGAALVQPAQARRRREDVVDRRAAPADRRGVGALEAGRQRRFAGNQELDVRCNGLERLQPLGRDRVNEGEGFRRHRERPRQFVFIVVRGRRQHGAKARPPFSRSASARHSRHRVPASIRPARGLRTRQRSGSGSKRRAAPAALRAKVTWGRYGRVSVGRPSAAVPRRAADAARPTRPHRPAVAAPRCRRPQLGSTEAKLERAGGDRETSADLVDPLARDRADEVERQMELVRRDDRSTLPASRTRRARRAAGCARPASARARGRDEPRLARRPSAIAGVDRGAQRLAVIGGRIHERRHAATWRPSRR
jgi:hypothetical protein